MGRLPEIDFSMEQPGHHNSETDHFIDNAFVGMKIEREARVAEFRFFCVSSTDVVELTISRPRHEMPFWWFWYVRDPTQDLLVTEGM